MSGLTVAAVPIRSLTGGKTRLSGAVDVEARAELIRLMLCNVLRTLAETTGIDRVVVVSPEPQALALAADLLPGAELVLQPVDRPGLLPALDLGRGRALAAGAAALVVVFGDLPRLASSDIAALLAPGAEVVIAPDRDRVGTNALLLRGDAMADFTFRFGDRSFPAHLFEASRLGLEAAVVEREGLSFDLDTPSDLAMLPAAMSHAAPWRAAS